MPNAGIFIFVGMALLAVTFLIYAIISAGRRRKELSAWAEGKGLVFSALPNRELADDYPAFKCLHEGSDRHG